MILIVDDEPIILKTVAKILTSGGYSVRMASSGEEAVRAIEGESFDLIMSDQNMRGGMQGIDFLEYAKGAAPDSIRILLTRSYDEEILIDAINRGEVYRFLAKPPNTHELLITVKKALEHKTLLKERDALAKQEQVITKSRNKLRTVLDALRENVVSLDSDYCIVTSNNAFSQSLAKEPEEIVGKRCHLLINDLPAPCFNYGYECPVKKAFESGDAFVGKGTCDNGDDGILRHVEFMSLPIRDTTGKTTEVVKITRDVTELVKAMDELQKAQAELLQSAKMASIGQLAAGVAHEINNPMGFIASNLYSLRGYFKDISSMIGLYESLKNQALAWIGAGQGKEVLPFIEEIEGFKKEIDYAFLAQDIDKLIFESEEGANRIKKIVSALKEFSHIGAADPEPTDVNACIENALYIVWNHLKYKVKVIKVLEDLPKILSYPQKLGQALMNLFVNAADAISEHGEIRIESGLCCHDVCNPHILIKISDTGSGIPKDILPKIFDPFFTTKPVGKGTGLGLSIVYNIINKLNGQIEVESEEGRGAVFTIRLPVEISNLKSQI
ncbi:MAG: ATP-binding protein [Pseudomonadota bacterium]